MTSGELVVFLGTMIVLAALPSASVVLVVTRAATAGVRHGVAVAMGIVAGDLAFLLLAVLGLAAAAQALGGVFSVVRYVGGAYLLWFGFSLLRNARSTERERCSDAANGGLIASFFAGVLLTLGDIKAIVFYVSLLPLFVDVAVLGVSDMTWLVVLTATGIGSVKIAYALLARRFAARFGVETRAPALSRGAGVALIGAGGYLIVKP